MKIKHPFQISRFPIISILFIIVTLVICSCTKFVTVPPPTTQLVSSTVFSNDATATSAVLGIYSFMMQNNSMASINTTLYCGLSADELTDYSNVPDERAFYLNSINPANSLNSGLWANAYQYIYSANAVLEGLAASTLVTIATATQLEGEAKFIRAFCYFYLTNLYGDVPLVLSTDYTSNQITSRTPQSKVYDQIVKDLLDAQASLSTSYLDANGDPTMERVRPNKSAATALLARVYLYLQDYKDAEVQASQVIDNNFYFLPQDLDSVFLKNSSETIWALMPVNPNFNTIEGNTFILTTPPTGATGNALSPFLLDSFETNDKRRTSWVDSFSSGSQTYYFAYKYKINTGSAELLEYSMVLRLAEQFLIRAECRANLNDFNGAQADLNPIRNRAGLPNTDANDLPSLSSAILHERQVELFTEWGHRWLDLKRTGTVSSTLAIVKPGWTPAAALFPLPQTEIKNDPNLTQNSGY